MIRPLIFGYIALAACLAIAACTWTKNTIQGQKLITGESQCAGDAIKTEVDAIQNAVIGILLSKAPNYQEQLDALAAASKTNGKNAVICAVFKAIAAFGSASATPTGNMLGIHAYATPHEAQELGRDYLKKNGVQTP
jgi:hypothetical protein